jgi:hypothetical protein
LCVKGLRLSHGLGNWAQRALLLLETWQKRAARPACFVALRESQPPEAGSPWASLGVWRGLTPHAQVGQKVAFMGRIC